MTILTEADLVVTTLSENEYFWRQQDGIDQLQIVQAT